MLKSLLSTLPIQHKFPALSRGQFDMKFSRESPLHHNSFSGDFFTTEFLSLWKKPGWFFSNCNQFVPWLPWQPTTVKNFSLVTLPLVTTLNHYVRGLTAWVMRSFVASVTFLVLRKFKVTFLGRKTLAFSHFEYGCLKCYEQMFPRSNLLSGAPDVCADCWSMMINVAASLAIHIHAFW